MGGAPVVRAVAVRSGLKAVSGPGCPCDCACALPSEPGVRAEWGAPWRIALRLGLGVGLMLGMGPRRRLGVPAPPPGPSSGPGSANCTLRTDAGDGGTAEWR